MPQPPFQLPQALAAWGSAEFAAVLKAELQRLDPAALPLQEGLARGSHVSGDHFEVMILSAADAGAAIRVRTGIHYQSIIAGCSCADDPTPVDELTEYCEAEIEIDKAGAQARARLVEE